MNPSLFCLLGEFVESSILFFGTLKTSEVSIKKSIVAYKKEHSWLKKELSVKKILSVMHVHTY